MSREQVGEGGLNGTEGWGPSILGTIHGSGSDRVLTRVRSNLEDETATTEVLDFEGVENKWRVLCLGLGIHDGINDRSRPD